MSMRNRFSGDNDDDMHDIFGDDQWPPKVAIRTAKIGASAAYADLFDVVNAIALYLGHDEEVEELRVFLLNLAVKTIEDEEETTGDDH